MTSAHAQEQSAGPRLAAAFKRLDTNGDGKITPTEAPDRIALIKLADADGSGDATLAELKAYFQELRDRVSEDKAEPSTPLAEPFPKGAPVSPDSCRKAAAHSDAANGHAVVVIRKPCEPA